MTERLRLIPNIVVLPYRNPFLVAKAVATLDALSDGRFTLAVATGYMRGEYRALGVDFEQRNVLFDEAIEVIRGVWSTTSSPTRAGLHAPRQTANRSPRRIRRSGSAGTALSRHRVARYGDGWSPFPAPRVLATTAKTRPLETWDDLRPMLDELWQFSRGGPGSRQHRRVVRLQAGGVRPATVQSRRPTGGRGGAAALGVTWSGVGVPGDSLAHALETLERYGATVIR